MLVISELQNVCDGVSLAASVLEAEVTESLACTFPHHLLHRIAREGSKCYDYNSVEVLPSRSGVPLESVWVEFLSDVMHGELKTWMCKAAGCESNGTVLRVSICSAGMGQHIGPHYDKTEKRASILVYLTSVTPDGGSLAVYPPGAPPINLHPEAGDAIVLTKPPLHEVHPVGRAGKRLWVQLVLCSDAVEYSHENVVDVRLLL